MYDEGLAGQEAYNGDSFADGKAAMAIVGPWAISVYGDDGRLGSGARARPSAGTPAEETYTFSDAKNVGMYTACENQGTAWDVLKFATSEEQDGQLLELTGQMPLRQDLTGRLPRLLRGQPGLRSSSPTRPTRTVEVPNVPNSIEVWQTFRDAYSQLGHLRRGRRRRRSSPTPPPRSTTSSARADGRDRSHRCPP